nr:MAG TPA: hypothetical protein [Caudoviricetes sp.]
MLYAACIKDTLSSTEYLQEVLCTAAYLVTECFYCVCLFLQVV